MDTDSHASILPEGYQQVKFIKATGTQYIDTGIHVPDYNSIIHYSKLSIEIDFRLTNLEQNAIIAGLAGNSSWTWIYLEFGINNGKYFARIETTTYTIPDLTVDSNWHNLKIVGDGTTFYVYIDNILKWSIARNKIGSFLRVQPCELCLFASHRTRTIDSQNYIAAYCECEISHADIYAYKDNGSIQWHRDLYACYRESDNVIGMYDMVPAPTGKSQFLTNKGTGEFIKGGKV